LKRESTIFFIDKVLIFKTKITTLNWLYFSFLPTVHLTL